METVDMKNSLKSAEKGSNVIHAQIRETTFFFRIMLGGNMCSRLYGEGGGGGSADGGAGGGGG